MEIPNKFNNIPIMHKKAEENKLGAWCLLNIIGGDAGVQNGQKQYPNST